MSDNDQDSAQEFDVDGNFVTADARALYAVFIDRYEHLDRALRSLPAPRNKDAVQHEKARVEEIIQRICRSR